MNNNHTSKEVSGKGHFIDIKETGAFYLFLQPCPQGKYSIGEMQIFTELTESTEPH